MEPDLDDTRLSVPRTPTPPPGVDLDDTVVRSVGAGPAEVAEGTAPPALVEPPVPEARAVPVGTRADLPVAPAPVVAAAPYRAVLPDGDEVVIDVAVYVGRKPSVPRIHVGPAPRLIAMPSPGREMSATHLELRMVGDALVASDMRSTNGTVVQLPGAAPRTLIRGESAVLVPGSRIDLGEGAVLDILAPAGADA